LEGETLCRRGGGGDGREDTECIVENMATTRTSDLFKQYALKMDELKERGVIRTANNPVSDYAEWLFAKAMKLDLMPNSSAGYD